MRAIGGDRGNAIASWSRSRGLIEAIKLPIIVSNDLSALCPLQYYAFRPGLAFIETWKGLSTTCGSGELPASRETAEALQDLPGCIVLNTYSSLVYVPSSFSAR